MQTLKTVLWGALVSVGCGDDGAGAAEDGDTESGGIEVTATESSSSGSSFDSTDSSDDGLPTGDCAGDGSCKGRVDLLFIIDNSGSMGEEQLNLARNLPLLIQRLEGLTDAAGNEVAADVHIMVTTTDSGNPLCDPFYPPGRQPEMGAPISSPCTDRLERFTSVAMPPVNMEAACNDVCPDPIAPDDDYIAFSGSGSNVPDSAPIDVNGDGIEDSAVAQALACVGPQGIDGCGYERSLDSMMRALDSDADHNTGDAPFLRGSEALLGVVIVSDEADCSIADDSVMSDVSFQEDNPDNGMPRPTSAVCWNAGVSCDGPDGQGVYSDCTSTGNDLIPAGDYVDFLQGLGRPVVMLGILGVPLVTEHNEDPPFEPTAGGVFDLVYRDWQDPDFPNGGDILPDEWNDGKMAAHKQADFGIGPGCTGEDGDGGFTGQAVPPVRVKEVCEALDIPDDPDTPDDETQVRCCIESICDTDFSAAIGCLGGLIQTSVVPIP